MVVPCNGMIRTDTNGSDFWKDNGSDFYEDSNYSFGGVMVDREDGIIHTKWFAFSKRQFIWSNVRFVHVYVGF